MSGAPSCGAAGPPDRGEVVVIGVGNTLRRDDGVGHVVLGSLRDRVPEGVRLVALDGEATRIIDAWTGAALAVVVDAVRSDRPAGSLQVLAVDPESAVGRGVLPEPAAATSSHTSGLSEALALGAALDRLPGRLVVVGIVAADVGDGPGLSEPVEAAVDAAVMTVCLLSSGAAR